MDEQTVGVVDNKEYVQKLPRRKKNPFIFVHSQWNNWRISVSRNSDVC